MVGCVGMTMMSGGFCAPNMTGTASINITSDTAAAAKNIALDEARRQIIRDVLGTYSDAAQLDTLVQGAADSDLTPLIAKSKINNEQQSSTTYSADITMTLERVAARNWLNDNGVQNWLGDPEDSDKTTIIIRTANGLNDWIAFNTIARTAGIAVDSRRIDAGRIIVQIPASNRTMITAAARDAGWHYSDADGVLNLWK